ncbi:gene transfer agent host specificity protein [Caulobacter phage C1]|nr:gene transfer agent host specificity protein [Caulobacter phage C1]UTU08388.1 gene transfer agent host specificity protein [Caulobacter phage C2]UTU08905.1 gene transfer agent host specificity protein [Caulobacter phage J4]UTU10021.1 gene transfer agent host specificity protein [Caulobacter phage RB23]WGN97056.1 gene transfer agent host specificity protein [Bertelyvirus sp.]
MADQLFSFATDQVVNIGVSFLFPSKGPRLKDLKMSASTYGAAIPIVFGSTRVPGNMIWGTGIKEHKRKKLSVAGKGGFYLKYTYTASVAFAFCKGPITSFRRIWADGKVIYDNTGKSKVANKKKYKFRFYLGDEDQVPNSTIEADKGVGNAPAYRGLAYMVIEDMPLEDFGNHIPQITAEVYNMERFTDTPQVPVTALKEDGTPRPLSYQGNSFSADTTRGYFYLTDHDFKHTGKTVLRRFNMETGDEDMAIQPEFMNTAAGVGIYDDQSLLYLHGVKRDGTLFVANGGLNNYVAASLIEPQGYNTIATQGVSDAFGRSNAGLGLEAGYPPTDGSARTTAYSITGNGREMFLWWGLFGDVTTFDVTDVNQFQRTGGTTWPVRFGSVYNGACVCGSEGLASNQFYGALGAENPDQAAGIGLYDITTGGPGRLLGFLERKIAGLGLLPYWIMYDAYDPGILMAYTEGDSSVWMAKFSLTNMDWRWRKRVAYDAISLDPRLGTIVNGEYAWLQSTPYGPTAVAVYVIDTLTGQYIQKTALPPELIDPDDVQSPYVPDEDYHGIPVDRPGLTATGSQFFNTRNFSIVSVQTFAGVGDNRITFLGPKNGYCSLGFICDRLLRMAGLTSKQIDMSRLMDTPVLGYGWAQATDLKSVLDQLKMIYLFDIVESDGKMTGFLRTEGSNEGAPVAFIKKAALGSSSPDAVDYWTETRLQEAEIPQRISLTYLNYDRDYQESVAMSKRIVSPYATMQSNQLVAIEANLILKPSEAKERVNHMLYDQWNERTRHTTNLPWAYLDLDPSDWIEVRLDDDRTYSDRIQRMEVGADFALSVEAYGRDGGAYEPQAVAADGGTSPTQTIHDPGQSAPFVINTPLLRDSDDSGGNLSVFYYGVGNNTSKAFDGSSLYRSLDQINYDELDNFDKDLEWGVTTNVLPKARHGHFALDWESRLTIQPYALWFELESITDDELWAGHNALLVGDEIIQFRDAVENPDKTWTIWNLLRGRRGTEYATHTHKKGDRVIVLQNEGTLEKAGETIDVNGQVRYYKAVSRGQDFGEGLTQTLVYRPRDLMPYAPKDIRRSINGDGTMTFTWRRRTRLGGGLQDYTGTVPVNETTERYEVYIYVNTTPAVDLSAGVVDPSYVTRAETTTDSFVWSYADLKDWMSLPVTFDVNLDTVTVVVYQVSSAVGRGFPGMRVIEPWQDF